MSKMEYIPFCFVCETHDTCASVEHAAATALMIRAYKQLKETKQRVLAMRLRDQRREESSARAAARRKRKEEDR